MLALLSKWGLGWLVGPIGKGLLLASAAMVAVTFIRDGAVSSFEADVLRDRIVQMEGELVKAAEIVERSNLRSLKAEAELAELKKVSDEIFENRKPSDGCTIDPELRERLRSIY